MLDFTVLPARGGSKRIKNKNLTPFLNRSMIFRAIDSVKDISKTIVISSDSDLILNSVATEFLNIKNLSFEKNLLKIDNFIFLKRSKELSDDFTPTISVTIDAIKRLKIQKRALVATLYPTAMFAKKNHILDSIKELKKSSKAFVVSVHKNNSVYRSFTKSKNEGIKFLFKENITKRTQDLSDAYNDAGQFYIGQAKSYLKNIPLLGKKSLCYDIGIAKDIDTMLDLKIAEMIYSLKEAD